MRGRRSAREPRRTVKSLALVPLLAVALLPAAADAAVRKADLAVSRASVSADLQVAVSVRNAGRGVARPSTLQLWLSRDARRGAGDVAVATAPVKRIAARRTLTATVRVAVPRDLAAGSYVVIACADGAAKVREAREGNNCRAASGRVTVLGPSQGGAQPGPAPPHPDPDADARAARGHRRSARDRRQRPARRGPRGLVVRGHRHRRGRR